MENFISFSVWNGSAQRLWIGQRQHVLVLPYNKLCIPLVGLP